MPWRELKPMDMKVLFIADYLQGAPSFSALCEAYEISRKTGYKWVERFEKAGPAGLEERSRRRLTQDWVVPLAVREAIIELRGKGQTEPGPKKIQAALQERFPDQAPPSKTTIYNILKKAELIKPRRLRQRVAVYPKPLEKAESPNQLFSADYKGQFLTGAGVWCYPLTIMDHASRFLLACHSMANTNFLETQAVFTEVFRENGLPERIRTDNGVPFASKGRAGSPNCPFGGCAWASFLSALRLADRSKMVATSVCTEHSKVRFRHRPQWLGRLNNGTSTASGNTTITSGSTKH